MKEVLVVDDYPPTRRSIVQLLNRAGLQTLEADKAEESLELIRQHDPALMVLDGSPGPHIDSLDYLRRIKLIRGLTNLPVIFVADVRMCPTDETAALELGANLVLTRTEIAASAESTEAFVRHVLALAGLKHRPPNLLRSYHLDGLVYNRDTGELRTGGRIERLNRKEAALFEIFLRRPNMLHSASFLRDSAWDYTRPNGWLHTLENRVSSLRQKCGKRWGRRLICRKGIGFILRLDSPVTRVRRTKG